MNDPQDRTGRDKMMGEAPDETLLNELSISRRTSSSES